MKATSEREGDGSVGRRDIAHSSFSSVRRGRKGEREGWAVHTTPRHAAFLLISLSLSHKSHSVSAAKAFHQEPQKEIRGERRERGRETNAAWRGAKRSVGRGTK